METRISTLRDNFIKYISRKVALRALFGCLGILFALGCAEPDANKLDVTAPTLDFVSPNDGVTDAPVGGNLTATFSEELNPATVTTASFRILEGSTPVPGIVEYSGLTATFTPDSVLLYDTAYRVTITTAILDLAGNALEESFVWSFTTEPNPDATPPEVLNIFPADAASGVVLTENIIASFSEPVNPLTVTTTTFTLVANASYVPGSVEYIGATATFYPAAELLYGTVYTATLTTGIEDAAGNARAENFVWTFTTLPNPDTTPPVVESVFPADSAVGTPSDGQVLASFNESLDPLTVTETTFRLTRGGVLVPGLATAAGRIATFTPAEDLAGNTVYTATLTTGITDLAGNALVAEETWSFTVETTPVNLGSAGDYVILASSGITNAADTVIQGDVGTSPGTSADLVGFALVVDASGEYALSEFVTGKVYASDYSSPTPADLGTAIADMNAAYLEAGSLPGAVSLGSGELGGRTITPGVYQWGAAVTITTDCTLDGGPDDLWIFQITGALSMTAAISVHLTGGASAKNVFWQTVGAASLGADAHLEGIVLSSAVISLGAGATVVGRLYAATFATLGVGASVTQPAQ